MMMARTGEAMLIPNAQVGEKAVPIPLAPPRGGQEPDAGVRIHDNSGKAVAFLESTAAGSGAGTAKTAASRSASGRNLMENS